MTQRANSSNHPAARLLIADSDPFFRRSLQRAMERRGFYVVAVATVAEAIGIIERACPDALCTELRLDDGNGLDIVSALTSARPGSRCVVLSSYASLPTAVAAARLGVSDVLTKSTDAETIGASLRGGMAQHLAKRTFARPEAVELAYLIASYEQHRRNMSETARALGMHRRTLQRILRRHGIAHADADARNPNSMSYMRRMLRVWSDILDGREPVVSR